VLANSLKIRGRHRVNNMNPEADMEAEGWGNRMIEGYTENCTGQRAVRNRLKVDTASKEFRVEGDSLTL
jgi:hypothetical protein